jgi:hypothetical protein
MNAVATRGIRDRHDPSMGRPMRSPFASAIPVGGVLVTGLLLATTVAPARADRPGPELIPLTTSVVVAGPRPTPVAARRFSGCGTLDATAGELDGVRTAVRRWADENPVQPSTATIRIAFHVITGRGEGNVSDARIAQQIDALNRDFAAAGYHFELASVDRTENAGWFAMTPGSGREKQAKQALAIDPARRLNVYTCSPGQDLRGWASYPWSAPEASASHGVVLDYTSLPGGDVPDLGRTATHEVGHYLGLVHDGASAVELTPAQQERVHAIVPVYRPSLFSEPVVAEASTSEIVPGAGSEPEDGRVLAFRGAFPNPFRAETAIRFTLPASAEVSLRIYSVTGQLARTLVDAQLPPGDHSAMFRAGELPSGAYFAVLRVGRVQMSRTLLLVR